MDLKSVDEFVVEIEKFVSIPDDSVDYLKVLLDKLLNDIARYTNRQLEEVPGELNSDIIIKVVNWVKDSGIFLTDEERQANAPVSSISEGDTTVNFAVKQQDMTTVYTADLLDRSFKNILNHYRRVSWEAN